MVLNEIIGEIWRMYAEVERQQDHPDSIPQENRWWVRALLSTADWGGKLLLERVEPVDARLDKFICRSVHLSITN